MEPGGRFSRKVVLITGGGDGIGRGIAARMIAEGARVVISDIDGDVGEHSAQALGCEFVLQDIASEAAWAETLRGIEARHGELHVLVNNAGIEGPFENADIEGAALEDWRRIQQVNAEGVFLGCQAAIPLMTRSGGGAIVNLSSTAALSASPAFVAYGASKAAVRHLTTSIAVHCARNGSGIRCNSVHPGPVLTPMLQRIAVALARKQGRSPEAVLETFRQAIPQGEFLTIEDIASAVAFLACDEARHITGAALAVDGGATL